VRAVRQRPDPGPWLLLLPYLVGATCLVAVPAVVTVGFALFEWDFVRPPRFVGLANFEALLDDPVFRTSIRNSLLFALSAVPLRLVGALALALLLHPRLRGGGAYRASVVLPAFLPDVAFALLWLWILNPLYGPLNTGLAALGLPSPNWLTDPAAARWAVVLMSVVQLGEGFLIALAVRASLPRQLYDAAAIEAAGSVHVLRRVTLPLMAPALLVLAVRDTALSFQSTFVPALLVTDGGPPPYATTYLPLFAYRNGFEYLRYGYAAAATIAMIVLTGVLVYLQWRLIRRWLTDLR
jgi:multiple sugar transport system permease protein